MQLLNTLVKKIQRILDICVQSNTFYQNDESPFWLIVFKTRQQNLASNFTFRQNMPQPLRKKVKSKINPQEDH